MLSALTPKQSGIYHHQWHSRCKLLIEQHDGTRKQSFSESGVIGTIAEQKYHDHGAPLNAEAVSVQRYPCDPLIPLKLYWRDLTIENMANCGEGLDRPNRYVTLYDNEGKAFRRITDQDLFELGAMGANTILRVA